MRKFVLTSCLLCAYGLAGAQNTAGKISYTETVKLNIDLGGDIDIQSNGDVNAAAIRDMMPKERSIKKVLYYNADAALYINDKAADKKESDNIEHNDGNVRMMIKMDVPEDITYTSLKDNKLTEQRDFMGRKFLMTSDIDKAKWKMTGNQKTILSYPCQEAVMIRDKDTITAWFTAAIPVSAGPQNFGGLPGMILEARQNSMITLKADAVQFGTDNNALIVKPKEGKKVTKEEFKAIVDKKQKEMQEENGGNGNVIIKINR